jgi:CHAT domain-containing protein/Tfp pilus assembly protein PilF
VAWYHTTTAQNQTRPSVKTQKVEKVNEDGAPASLEPGKTIERYLNGAESHAYSIAAKPGQFVRVTAEQKGVDLVLVIFDQEGKSLAEVDSPNGIYGPESFSFAVNVAQSYQIRVKSLEEKAAGNYSITAEVHNEVSDDDKTRLEAEQNFQAARNHDKEKTRASVTAAVNEYQAAAAAWHKVNDRYWESLALVNLAHTYWALRNNELAFDNFSKALALQRASGDRRSESNTLNVIGLSYAAIGEFEKSLDFLQQALSIKRSLSDQAGVKALLNNIGQVHENLANQYYYEALTPSERGEYWYRMATRAREDDKDHDVIGSLRKALEFDPTNTLYLRTLMSAFKFSRKFAEGLKFVDELPGKGIDGETVQELKMELDYAFAADLEAGSPAEAVKHYQAALKTDRFRQGQSSAVDFTDSYSLLTRYDPLTESFDMELRIESGQVRGADFNEELSGIQQDIAAYNQKVASLQQSAHQNIGSFGIEGRPLLNALEENLKDTKAGKSPAEYAAALTNLATTHTMLAEFVGHGVTEGASSAPDKREVKERWRKRALEVYGAALTLRKNLNDRYGEASVLNDLGVLSLLMGQYADADKYFQQSLTVFRNLNDRAGTARVLTNAGASALVQNRTADARKSFESALEISRALGNGKIEALSLQYLGSLDPLNDLSVKNIEAALALSRQLKNNAQEARLLLMLGDALRSLHRPEAALAQYQNALQVIGDSQNRPLRWSTFRSLGDLQATLNQFGEAARNYHQAMDVNASTLGERANGSLYANVGLIQHLINQDNEAEESYRLAQLFKGYEKDARGQLAALLKLAALRIANNDYGNATSDYEEALVRARDLNDANAITQALIGLGGANYLLNQFQKSIDSYQQALSRLDEAPLLKANVLINLSSSLEALNLYNQAIDRLNEALTIATGARAQAESAAILNNLGLNLTYLAEYPKAISFYERALLLRQQVKDRTGEAVTLNNLAFCFTRTGETRKASEFYQRALTIERELSDSIAQGRTLGNLSELEAGLAHYENAERLGQQALKLSRDTNDRGGEGSVLYKLGSIYLAQGKYQQALDLFADSMTVFKALNTTARKGLALNGMMLSWKGLGQPERAIFYGKQAVNAYQQVRSNLRSLDLRQSFLRSKEDTYRTLASLLIAQDRLPEAESVLDLLKEEEFSQLIRRGESASTNIPYVGSETQALKIIDRLAAIGLERRDLLEKQSKQALGSYESKRLNELEEEIKTANAELRRTFDSLSAADTSSANRVDEIRKEQSVMRALRELGKGTVALYTVIGGNAENLKDPSRTGWVVLVTPDFRKAYPIDVVDLEQVVVAFRETLRSDKNDPRPLGQKLYQKLFLQVSEKQKTTLAADLETYLVGQEQPTLMWSLDGALRYVPINALFDGKKYLVERYRNTVFNTASLDSLKDASLSQWTVLGLGVTEPRQEEGKTFPALSGAERELRAIVHQQDGKPGDGIVPGVIKLNKDFNRQTMVEGLRTGYPLVHIASHFSFNVANPPQSFLLLGQDHLSVADLQDMSNPFERVELLTLSACDTAVGSANGKEVEGFAYTAQSLGAKSVIASLWPVSDAGTEALMRRFYTLRRDQPQLPKGEALRQAQLSLLRGDASANSTPKESEQAEAPRASVLGAQRVSNEQTRFITDANKPFAHPYYWAPFILIGNWK